MKQVLYFHASILCLLYQTLKITFGGKKKRWLIIFELMREGDEHRRVTFDATNISASLAVPSPYPLQKVWSVRILAFGSYPHHRYPQLDIHF